MGGIYYLRIQLICNSSAIPCRFRPLPLLQSLKGVKFEIIVLSVKIKIPLILQFNNFQFWILFKLTPGFMQRRQRDKESTEIKA